MAKGFDPLEKKEKKGTFGQKNHDRNAKQQQQKKTSLYFATKLRIKNILSKILVIIMQKKKNITFSNFDQIFSFYNNTKMLHICYTYT